MPAALLRCRCAAGTRTPAALRGVRRLPLAAERAAGHRLQSAAAARAARPAPGQRGALVLSARSSGDAAKGARGGSLVQRGRQLPGRALDALRDIPARGRGLLLLNLLVRAAPVGPRWACSPRRAVPLTRRAACVQVVLCATNMVVIKGSEGTFDAFAFSLGRFCIAAMAFAPFLSEGLADETLWAPAAELGLWMGLGAPRPAVARPYAFGSRRRGAR